MRGAHESKIAEAVTTLSAVEGGDDRFQLLNDLPVDAPEHDLLHTSAVAADLGRLIVGSRDNTPFVVAIDGRWGAGKSTLMQQLSAELRAYGDFEVVWFNAWTASGVSALVGMLKLVLARLDRNVVRRSFRRLNAGGLLTGTVRLVLTAIAGFLRADRALEDLWRRVPVDAEAREQAKTLLRDALTQWTDRGGGRPRRTIVVFVDDLDRCGHRAALEICEAIKLYLDVPGIAFILGCDLGVLSRIAVPGGGDAEHVRGYLEKIIQVNYQIPLPSTESTHAMITGYARRSGTERLFTETMTDLIGRQTGGNPRRVKRLINSFVTEYQLDPGWRGFGAEGLMKAVALQHFYPDLYREILSSTGDTVGELLTYKAARQLLLGSADERAEEANEYLRRRGIAPPEPGGARYAPNEVRELLSQLDERTSPGWPSLVDSPDALALLDALGDVGERQRLQQRLRRRPLSTAPTPAGPSGGGASKLDRVRLLWIDDNPTGNETLINNLASRGAQVRTAADGQQALDLLAAFRPNAVLSDVFRAGVEAGFDDLRELVDAGYGGSRYFFTSRVTPDLREKAEAVGAAGITAMPGAVITWLEALQDELMIAEAMTA